MQTFVSNLRPAESVGAPPSAPSKDWTMRANVEHLGVDADWTIVSGAKPCPVCGGFDECRTHVEECFACCRTQPSEWRLENGGWLHRIELAATPPADEQTLADGDTSGVVP